MASVNEGSASCSNRHSSAVMSNVSLLSMTVRWRGRRPWLSATLTSALLLNKLFITFTFDFEELLFSLEATWRAVRQELSLIFTSALFCIRISTLLTHVRPTAIWSAVQPAMSLELGSAPWRGRSSKSSCLSSLNAIIRGVSSWIFLQFTSRALKESR